MYKHGESLFKSVFETKLAYLIIFCATIFFVYSGSLTSSGWTLPAFAPMGVYMALLYSIKLGNLKRGIRHLCFWGFILAISIFIYTLTNEIPLNQTLTGAVKFTNNKFYWIKASQNFAANNYEYTVFHLKKTFLILVSALVSGGYIALLIISRDIAKLAYYVGRLFTSSGYSMDTMFIAWEIWTIFKIVGFLYCTISLSSFFLYFIMDFELEKRQIIKYFSVGIILIILSFFIRYGMLRSTHTLLHKQADKLFVNKLPGEKETTDFKFYF